MKKKKKNLSINKKAKKYTDCLDKETYLKLLIIKKNCEFYSCLIKYIN